MSSLHSFVHFLLSYGALKAWSDRDGFGLGDGHWMYLEPDVDGYWTFLKPDCDMTRKGTLERSIQHKSYGKVMVTIYEAPYLIPTLAVAVKS